MSKVFVTLHAIAIMPQLYVYLITIFPCYSIITPRNTSDLSNLSKMFPRHFANSTHHTVIDYCCHNATVTCYMLILFVHDVIRHKNRNRQKFTRSVLSKVFVSRQSLSIVSQLYAYLIAIFACVFHDNATK